MSSINQSAIRVDARSKVTGEAQYPGDFDLPEQAYMKILFAARPHAIIHSIDVSKAEAVHGVLAVFTAADVPVNNYGLIMPDQPVLCGPGSDIPYADRVRFVGDQVALIIAETEEIAVEARDLIEVEYEDLPIATDPRETSKPDAFLLHPDNESNVILAYRVRKGDIEVGFKDADVIVESIYETPAQEHAYLQPEAGISYIDEEGRVTVVVAGQWTHEDREQIAHVLDIPEDQVRVIYPAIGGAFGGREDMSVQIVLGLASWRLQQRGIKRPIKIIWSREESMIGHCKRHPYYMKAKWGATSEGKIVAAEVSLVADGGAYAFTSTKVLGNATLTCTGPYEIPHVKVDTSAVYTNNIPGGAFRGFGGPQGSFLAESQVNKLAEKLGLDPIEFRMRNLIKDGSLISVNTAPPVGVTIREVTEKCAGHSGWQKTPKGWQRKERSNDQQINPSHIRRGLGFACAMKNVGFSYGAPEGCWATIELYGEGEIERAVLRHAAAEVGQGTHTALAQMAAEGLGIPLEKVELILSDTATTENSGSVSASRMTFMAGNAVKETAELALEKWRAEERPVVVTHRYNAPKTTPLDPVTGECDPNVSYGYVAEAVEVEVDIETGHIRIIKVLCADDVGKAINPQQVVGQIEGCVVQAAGYTILENFIQQNGKVLTPGFSTYLIPTVLDIPDEVESMILEYPDPRGPWGARGMGEMPYLPMAPAITDAIHDAIGVWIDTFVITPERVLQSIGQLD